MKPNRFRALKHQLSRGYGLIEALVVATAIMAAIVAIYGFYQRVHASKVAYQESTAAAELTNRIVKAYGATANFTGLSNSSIINEGLVPNTMEISGTQIMSVLGGNMTVSPETIDGVDGAGFRIAFSDVNPRHCAKVVSNLNGLNRFRQIIVSHGTNGAEGSQGANAVVVGENGAVNQATLSEACEGGQAPDLAFVYQRQTTAASTASLEPCVVPSPQTRTQACASGYAGEIVESRTASCDSPYGLPVWSNWEEVSNTCALICTPAPSSPETRSQACASGYIGSITEQRESVCSSYTGTPSWTSWHVVSDTCAIACVPAAPEYRTLSCATGYLGYIKQRRESSCPQATGAPSWGAWTEVENTCQQECVIPTPSTQTRWKTASAACPTGYSGNKYWEYEEESTASCPQATGAPTWSSWVATGRQRNEDTSQCVSLCNPDSPLQRWVAAEGTCPTGYVGTVTFEKEQTRTSTCTPGATSPNTSAWNDTGVTRNQVSSCTPAGCTIPAGTTKTWTSGSNSCSGTTATTSLASGQSAVFGDSTAPLTGTASYTCTNGVLSTTATSPTCNVTSCTVPSGTTFNWSVGGAACTLTTTAAQYVAVGSNRTYSDATAPTTGSAAFACATGGVMSSTPVSGTVSCVGACPAAPAPDTREFAGCAAGQYGTWTQSNAYETSDYPSCWAQTTNTWTPSTAPAGECTNCPAPSDTTQTRWEARPVSCPTGYSGTKTVEYEQTRVATTTYTCPAGTATLPTPSTTYTTYTDTGNTRVASDTCTPNGCTITTGTSKTWTNGTNTCSASMPATTTISSGQTATFTDGAAPLTGSATYSCTAGVLSSTPSTSSCNITSCTVPSGTTFNWSVGGAACNFTTSSAAYVSVGSNASYSDGTAPTTGSAAFACSTGGVLSSTPNAGFTCVGACPAQPAADTRTYAGCTTGQYGSWTQSNPYESSAYPTCWSQTTNTWSPSTAPAGACTNCPAPSTATQTQWLSTSANNCPVNQYGSTSWQYEQSRTQTTSYSCPAGTTALPAPTVSAWSTWSNTGATRNNVSNCVNCPAASTETQTQWLATSANNCPAGQYGANSWEYEQSRTRSVTYSCPAGTAALPAPTYGTWGGWSNTGATRSNTSTCTNCPAATTEYNYQWVTVNVGCPAGYTGTNTYEKEQRQSRTKSYSCPSGTASLPVPGYSAWSGWSDTGATRNAVNSCVVACTPPATTYQATTRSAGSQNQNLSCASGQYGSISQTRSVSENGTITTSWYCPGPTSSQSTTWHGTYNYGTWSTTSNTCTSCPAATTEYNYQWVLVNNGCPAGYTGSNTYEKQQQQTRTKSYNCPAGTTTLPAASYTAWSGWSDTGATRNASNTCTPSCTSSSWIETETFTNCAAGKTLEYGERQRTVYSTCPGPTLSYSGWTVTYPNRCCTTMNCSIQ